MKNDKDRYTTEELAAKWGMQIATLQLWRMQGRGPKFIKLGHAKSSRVIYRREDVEKYEDEHLQKSTNLTTETTKGG